MAPENPVDVYVAGSKKGINGGYIPVIAKNGG